MFSGVKIRESTLQGKRIGAILYSQGILDAMLCYNITILYYTMLYYTILYTILYYILYRVTRQNTELRSVKTECGQSFVFFFFPSPSTLLPSLPSV